VYVEGRIRTRKWQDKESGQDRYSTEIVADRMQILGGRKEGEAEPAKAATGADYKAAKDGERTPAAPAKQGSHGGAFDSMDDDIPF